MVHSPSAPPFSFLCVCQHEPKKVFSGTEGELEMGLKRPNCVVSQAQELPAVLSPSTGKREQALGRCPGTELQ